MGNSHTLGSTSLSLSGFPGINVGTQGPNQQGNNEDGELGVTQLRSQLEEDNHLVSHILTALHLPDSPGSWKVQRHVLERQRDFYSHLNAWVESTQRHQTAGKDLETAGILTIHRTSDIAPKKGKNEKNEAVDVPLRDYYSAKQVKWLQKEIRRLILTLPSGYAAHLQVQKDFLLRLHSALKRRQLRKATMDATSPRDLFPQANPDTLLYQKWQFLHQYFQNDPQSSRYLDDILQHLDDLPPPDLLSLAPQPRHWEDLSRHFEQNLQTRTNLESALAKHQEAMVSATLDRDQALSELQTATAELERLQGDESRSDESAVLAVKIPQLEATLNEAAGKMADLKERLDKSTQELIKLTELLSANEVLRLEAVEFMANQEATLPLILAKLKPSSPDASLATVLLRHLHTLALEAYAHLDTAPVEDAELFYDDDDHEDFPSSSTDPFPEPGPSSSSSSSSSSSATPINNSTTTATSLPPPPPPPTSGSQDSDSFPPLPDYFANLFEGSSTAPPPEASRLFQRFLASSTGPSAGEPSTGDRPRGLRTSGISRGGERTSARSTPKPSVSLPESAIARRRRYRAARATLNPATESATLAPQLAKLLNLVQLHLINQVATATKPTGPAHATLRGYIQAVVETATALLERIHQDADRWQRHPARIITFVRHSYLTQVLRPLLTELMVLFEHAPQSYQIAADLVEPLLRLFDDLQRFPQDQEAAVRLDGEIHAPETFAVLEPVVLETPHNYSKNTEKESQVTTPGATHLVIAFDPRCATSANDRLEIHVPAGGDLGTQLAYHFSGGVAAWPKSPLVITGHSVTFKFFSDAFDTDWGFRAIVVGLCVKTKFSEIYDLKRTLCALLSSTCSALMSGPPLSRSEHQLARSLDYGLFSKPRGTQGALSSLDPYLQDLIANTEGSKAAADLSKYLSGRNMKITRSNWRTSLEHPEAKGPLRGLVRQFVALSLLYENLTETAKSSSPSNAEIDQLNKIVYTNAAKFNATLLGILNSIHNAGMSSGAASSSTPTASTPLPLSESDFFAISERRLALLLHHFDSVPNLHDPSGEIFRFLTESYTLNEGKILQRRSRRAQLRALAMRTLLKLLQTVPSASARQDLLTSIALCFMRITRDALGRTSHPLISTGGAEAASLTALTSAFAALAQHTVGILQDGNTDTNLRIAAFAVLTANFTTADLDLLQNTNVLAILHRLATTEDLITSLCARDHTLYKLAWDSFRLIVFRTLAGMSEQDLTPPEAPPVGLKPQSQLHPLQHSGLELILTAIESAIPVLLHRRSSMEQLIATASDDAEQAKAAYYRQEDYIYRFLTTLLLATHSQQCFDDLLRSERLGRVLVSFLEIGTLRLRRTALRALRRVLPVHTPSSADAFLPAASQSQHASFVAYLFGLIGNILAVEDPEERNDPEPSQTLYLDAEVVFSFNCELVMLCRTLFASPAWAEVLGTTVASALLQLPTLVNTATETVHSPDKTALHRTLAALAVVGGHTDKIRVGGRVEIRDSKELATVVSYDRYASSTRLLVDTSPTRISRPFDANRLLPLSEIEFDPSTFPLSSEIVSSFFLFNSTIHRRLADTVRPPSRNALLNSSDYIPIQVDLAYHQIRSRTLQALARLLRSNQSAATLCAAGALSNLLQLAVLPTDLTSFKTLEQLEQQEERLWELLYQRRHTILEPHTVQRLTQFEKLPYSLFARSGARLPTGFDRESSKMVRFPDGHSDMRVVVGHIDPTKTLFAVGQARANFPIPLELKAFYFEVSIYPPVASEREVAEAAASTIAVGICPRGHAFSSTPGDNKSYAYIGSTAQVAHGAGSLRGSTVGNIDYGEPFGPGDTIGVLLTHTRELIFTKNGQNLGKAPLDPLERSELYFPCVWIFQSGVRVSINFGQESFRFPFETLLPSGYVRDLKSASKPVEEDDIIELNPEEIQRQTKAQHLLALDLASDVRHCIIALERCNDDLNQAAEWLMAGGGQQIIIAEEEEAFKRAIEESERLLMGDYHATPIRSEEPKDDDEEVEDDSLDAAIEGADGSDAFGNRNASRFLDDEIDAAIPVQVERRQRALDALSIEDLFVGMFLTVPLSHVSTGQSLLEMSGRTGVVKQVDVNAMRVELAFFDRETTSKFSHWFDFHSLERPTDIWDDPCSEISPSQLKQVTIEVEHALCILKVRRSVFKLIQNWPAFPFDLQSLGGAEQLIDLLKLAASEFLQERQSGSSPQSLMVTLRDRLALLLTDAAGDLPTILTNECITHFKRAVDVPPPKKTYRSPPNDRMNVDIKKRIHLPGANKLLIQFHHFDIDNGQLTRLAFFRDSQFQINIASFRGTACRPLLVDGDTVYMRYQTGLNKNTGYRFSVTPYEMRLNDRNALAGLNFSLGYWLLELLLDHGCAQVAQSYCGQLYTSLVHYVNHTKRGAKARGIQLLLRVLQEMNISADAISMQEFEKLRIQMFRMYAAENKEVPLSQSRDNNNQQSSGSMHSAHLQSLIELMATARLSQLLADEKLLSTTASIALVGGASTEPSSASSVDASKGKGYLTSSVGSVSTPSFTLRILEAYPAGDPEMNFSSLLQEFIDHRFGGAYLHIPADHNQCPVLRDLCITGPLHLKYAITDSDGLLLDQCERRVNADEPLTLNPSSWFTDVVATAFTAHSIVKKKLFPRQIVNQAVRQLALQPSSLLLSPFAPLEAMTDGFGFSDVGYLGPQFSLTFWLFIAGDTNGKPAVGGGPDSSEEHGDRFRQILFKGNPKIRQFDLVLNCRRKRLTLCFNTVNSPSARKFLEIPTPIAFDRWFSCGFSLAHNRVEVYLDGHSVLAEDLVAPPNIVSEPFIVGQIPVGLGLSSQEYPGFIGGFRDLRFFNRPLLPPQVAQLADLTNLPATLHGKWSVPPLGPAFSEMDLNRFTPWIKELEQWTLQMDSDFVRACHDACDRAGHDPFHVPLELLTFDEKLYGTTNPELLRFRFAMIRLFNIRLANIFSLIDFSQSQISWSLASALFQIKGFIFTKTKMAMWNSILARTVARQGGSNHVRLNRHLSHRARERGDPEAKRSVFGQLFQQLHFQPPERLRITGQTWRVELVAEGGQDAGGVFRDSISHLCSDLQSSYLPLFVPVPNKSSMEQGETSSGLENWHLWIPNPASNTPYQLRMFAFVGKLMGIAIRAKHLLNLDLPPLIWKLLVGQAPLETDLAAIDTNLINLLRNLRGLPPLGRRNSEQAEQITEETFEDLDLKWEIASWVPGVSVPLIENGASIPVKWEERHLFAERALKYRMEAFDPQIEAIKKGLSAIIPIALLPLFTWQELELQVCGKRELDIELLKRNTNYTYGVSKDDPHVALHWKMLETFTPREHELFLRFVWGRGRLPIDDASFTQKYQIMSFSGGRGGKDENFLLPKSHTCFFQLELPRYRTLEQMCKMVRVAIENCISIDDDGQAAAADIEQALQIDE